MELPSSFLDSGFLLQKTQNFTISYFWLLGQFDEWSNTGADFF